MAWWSSARTSWRRLRELPGLERWWLLQAFLALPLVGLGLRGFGLRQVKQVLSNNSPLSSNLDADSLNLHLARARTIARLVDVAARHGLYRPACLPRSLTLWWLLRRQQIDGDLRIGVKPESGLLAAHAWVELQGVVLTDDEDVHQQFAPFNESI